LKEGKRPVLKGLLQLHSLEEIEKSRTQSGYLQNTRLDRLPLQQPCAESPRHEEELDMEVKFHAFLNSRLPDSCRIRNFIDPSFLMRAIYPAYLKLMEYRLINRPADM
jgi:hypothetical protein